MRITLGLSAAASLVALPLLAQATGPFDIERASISDSSRFYPFYVETTRPLKDAVRDGAVHEATPLIILDHTAGRLALSTEQMAFHHIAQGDIKGQPWMVSF